MKENCAQQQQIWQTMTDAEKDIFAMGCEAAGMPISMKNGHPNTNLHYTNSAQLRKKMKITLATTAGLTET